MSRRRRRNPFDGGEVVTFLLCATGLVVVLYAGKKLFGGAPALPPRPLEPDPDPAPFRPGVIDG